MPAANRYFVQRMRHGWGVFERLPHPTRGYVVRYVGGTRHSDSERYATRAAARARVAVLNGCKSAP